MLPLIHSRISARRSGVALLDTADARHDLPGRAVAALERVFVDERLLQRMKPAVALEPLDGGDLRAVVHHRERQARDDALSVHQDRACAAGALVAALLGAGQARPFPQHVQQRRAVVHRDLAGFAVDAYPHHRGRRGVCLLVFAAAGDQRSGRHHTADRYGRTDKCSPVEVDHSAQHRHQPCERVCPRCTHRCCGPRASGGTRVEPDYVDARGDPRRA